MIVSPSRCGPVLFVKGPGIECKAICEGSSALSNGKMDGGSLKKSEQSPRMEFTLCEIGQSGMKMPCVMHSERMCVRYLQIHRPS